MTCIFSYIMMKKVVLSIEWGFLDIKNAHRKLKK